MSRVDVRAAVRVYQDDDSDWGASKAEIKIENYWNDERGQWVVLEVSGRRFTVAAADLQQAIKAVTLR